MKFLHALFKLVRTSGTHKKQFAPPLQAKKPGSRVEQFYKLLSQSETVDDSTIAREVLATDPHDNHYKSFKHDRMKELINNILFLKVSSSNKGLRAFQKCMYYLFPGKFLVYMGRIDLGGPLLQKGLVIAEKMDFTHEQALALRYLEYYYLEKQTEQKCIETLKKLNQCLDLLQSEITVQNIYRMLTLELQKKRGVALH